MHTVVVTAANVAAATKIAERLHGRETQVQADAGYTGAAKRPEIVALQRKLDWQIASQRGAVLAACRTWFKALGIAGCRCRACCP